MGKAAKARAERESTTAGNTATQIEVSEKVHLIGVFLESLAFYIILLSIGPFVAYLQKQDPFRYWHPAVVLGICNWMILYIFFKFISRGFDVDCGFVIVKFYLKKVTAATAFRRISIILFVLVSIGLSILYYEQRTGSTLAQNDPLLQRVLVEVQAGSVSKHTSLLVTALQFVPIYAQTTLTTYILNIIRFVNTSQQSLMGLLGVSSMYAPSLPEYLDASELLLTTSRCIDLFVAEYISTFMQACSAVLMIRYGWRTNGLFEYTLAVSTAIIIMGQHFCSATDGPILNVGLSVLLAIYRRDLFTFLTVGSGNMLGYYTAAKFMQALC